MKTRNHFDEDIIEQVNKALNFVLEHILLSAWLVPGKIQREEELADMVNKELINMVGKGRGAYYILRMKRTISGRLADDWEKWKVMGI